MADICDNCGRPAAGDAWEHDSECKCAACTDRGVCWGACKPAILRRREAEALMAVAAAARELLAASDEMRCDTESMARFKVAYFAAHAALNTLDATRAKP